MSPVAEKEKQIPARTDERGVLIAGKPTLGIIAIAKKNHQKDEIYQFVGYLKDRLSKEQSIHLMMEEAVLYDEYEIVNRARRMQEEGADLIVLIASPTATWGPACRFATCCRRSARIFPISAVRSKMRTTCSSF